MIYNYCERCGPGLLAEPFNAASNLAFFAAAWLAWRLAGRAGARTPGVRLLVILAVLVGIGSLLFHTFATRWAEICDVLPIFAFELAFLWLYSRYLMGLSVGIASAALALFLMANLTALHFPHVLNGSLMYSPSLVCIALLASYHCRNSLKERWILHITLAVFSVALIFRTIDGYICPAFPIGTHFLWHLLNSVVLYLSMRALIQNICHDNPELTGIAGPG